MKFEHGRLLELAPDTGCCDLRFAELQKIDTLTKECLSRVGTRLAGDDVHHGRLAGAVWPDDATQFTGIDVERQVIDRPESVETDIEFLEIEYRAVADIQVQRWRWRHEPPDFIAAHGFAHIAQHAHAVFLRKSPAIPFGRKSVTRTNMPPSAKSQASGQTPVSRVFA